MAVHLTRIYTKTGDAGMTALGDGSRVPKTDPRIEAYADVDETNAAIGVALALGGLADELRAVLKIVQNDLFDVGADLCAPIVADPKWPPAAGHRDYVDPSGALVRRVQRTPGQAGLVHPAGRYAGGGAAARRAHRVPAGGAAGLGADRGRPGPHEPPGGQVPQPALGPALHPVPDRQPGRRREVGPRRGAAERVGRVTSHAIEGLTQ